MKYPTFFLSQVMYLKYVFQNIFFLNDFFTLNNFFNIFISFLYADIENNF